MMPVGIELCVLSLMGCVWLYIHSQVVKPVGGDQSYHVASARRDSRKARFYYVSVWIGIAAAFLSARCLEAISTSGVSFDSNIQRAGITGAIRGIEMWGLLVVGAVWSRVGKRVSHPNSDGQSLIPTAQAGDMPNESDRDKKKYR